MVLTDVAGIGKALPPAMLPSSENSDDGRPPVATIVTARSASPKPFPSLQIQDCLRGHTR
jgi:hypothetical protein